ncbi:MAG: radical SAM family heme chaperone HemW, partial [Beijerinckiaceae bacterium]
MTAPADPGFAVYVHWPFCASKCPYCDFNSHVRFAPVDEARHVAAFKRELARQKVWKPHAEVRSIFFGGGTPSLMKPETVGAIIDAVAATWTLESNAEITLEANPTSVEATRFRGYRAAGVNRVSLGVQAMNDADLRALGRLHSAEEAMQAVKIARDHFERYSFDLIYARPDQTPAQWRAELTQALSHAGDHISLYQLTIEPDTWFAKLHAAGKLKTPDADMGRDLWDVTQEVCNATGFPAYEISNHARPGGESRHNLVYWRYGDYAALGAGAHGRITTGKGRIGFANEKIPEKWLAAVEAHGHAMTEEFTLNREEQSDEFLLMGLRLREGIDPKRYEALSGHGLDPERIAFLV